MRSTLRIAMFTIFFMLAITVARGQDIFERRTVHRNFLSRSARRLASVSANMFTFKDKQLAFAAWGMVAADLIDVHTTEGVFSRCRRFNANNPWAGANCTENGFNLLHGRNPSTAPFMAFAVTSTMLEIVVASRLKDSNGPLHYLWLSIPATDMTLHGRAAYRNTTLFSHP